MPKSGSGRTGSSKVLGLRTDQIVLPRAEKLKYAGNKYKNRLGSAVQTEHIFSNCEWERAEHSWKLFKKHPSKITRFPSRDS